MGVKGETVVAAKRDERSEAEKTFMIKMVDDDDLGRGFYVK